MNLSSTMKAQAKDIYFMALAIEKAKQGIRKGQTPFGACIVKNRRVVVCVHNQVWATTDITAHAEVTAIRQACRQLKTIDLSGCVIYSTCEPCPMCFSSCHWAKISKIVYGANIADAKRAGFSELFISNPVLKRLGKSPIKISGHFLKNESKALFTEWKKYGKAKTY